MRPEVQINNFIKETNTYLQIIILVISFTITSNAITPIFPFGKTTNVSDIMGAWTCSELKDRAFKAPQRLFSKWAENKFLGDGSGVAENIAIRGNINIARPNLADLTTAIQVFEEAANGSPKKVTEILSDFMMGNVLGTLGTCIPGAIWTTATSLNNFAISLNEEIFGTNIKTFAKFANRDSNLHEPNNVEYFLNDFLKIDQSTCLFTNLRKKRTAFIEYAKVKLGINNLPPMPKWREGKNWNMAHSISKSMLNDAKKVFKNMS